MPHQNKRRHKYMIIILSANMSFYNNEICVSKNQNTQLKTWSFFHRKHLWNQFNLLPQAPETTIHHKKRFLKEKIQTICIQLNTSVEAVLHQKGTT